MKFKGDKKYFYYGLTIFCSLCGVILFYYILFYGNLIMDKFKELVHISMPILEGFILVFLLAPVLATFENKVVTPIWKKNHKEITEKQRKGIRVISLIITYVVILALLTGFLLLVIPNTITSIESIISQLPEYGKEIKQWFLEFIEKRPEIAEMYSSIIDENEFDITSSINTMIIPQLNNVVGVVKTFSNSIWNLAKGILNVLIGVIISIYVLYNKEKLAGQIKKLFYAVLNIDLSNKLIHSFRFIHMKFSGFINGKIVDSIIIGFLCFIGVSIMQMPYPILISVIIGITNIVPFFGPIIGAVPCALLILMSDPLQCVYFLIFILAIQQFDGNILGPMILGDSTGLDAFWVLFAVTIFGGIFGIGGVVIGVPAFAVIYAAIRAYMMYSLEKRKLPSDTELYSKVDYIDKESSTFVDLTPEKKQINTWEFLSRKIVRKNKKDLQIGNNDKNQIKH